MTCMIQQEKQWWSLMGGRGGVKGHVGVPPQKGKKNILGIYKRFIVVLKPRNEASNLSYMSGKS